MQSPEVCLSPAAEPFAAYHTLCEDDMLASAARKMAECRAEAKSATWETYDSPKTRRRNQELVGTHGEKLKEHRERIDKHKMYLMHIAQEADLVKHNEDQSSVPTINAVSKRIERNDRVENVLIAKGKDYEQHIDGLRQTRKDEEDVDLLFSPRICEQSAKNMANRSEPVHKRLISWGKMKDQERRLAKNRQEEQEENRKKMELNTADDASHPHHLPDGTKLGNRVQDVLGIHAKGTAVPPEHVPVINKASSVKHREYQDCLEWGEQLKKQKEHVKEMFEENEMANLQDQPTISARSKKLVAKDTERDSMPIEDSLLKRGVEAKQRFKEKADQESYRECPHKPQITNYAAGLEREGDVSERLYAKSFEYRAKKQEMQEHQMREIQDMAARRQPGSPQASQYSPHYLNPAEPLVPIEIDLQRREQERQARREQEQELREQEEALLHYPKINTMSDLIAKQLPEDSIERLLKPRKEYVYEQPVDTNLTFHPRINARSETINAEKVARGEAVDYNRNEYLYSKDEENKFKMEQARRQAEQRELEHCTFQPTINRNSANMAPTSAHSVVTRTNQWQKQRMARLRQQREELEQKEKEACTFQPTIREYKKPRSKAIRTKRASTAQHAGIKEHVDRQAKARNQRKEIEDVPRAKGDKWTNEVTTPKEFTFSHKIKIKSLDQPIHQQNAAKEAVDSMQAITAPDHNRVGTGYVSSRPMSAHQAATVASQLDGDISKVQLGGTVSSEWAKRAAEKHAAEEAHSLAGMSSPRYYAGDALHSEHSGKTPRGLRGEDAFIERMRQARVDRETKEAAEDRLGSGLGYTGKVTKPKEFNFASASVRVKALSQPVSPMHR